MAVAPTDDGLCLACPADAAFGSANGYDFGTASSINDLSSFWIVDDGIKFNQKVLTLDKSNGASFVISGDGQAPTLISKQYLFFGRVEVEIQAAPGSGIITSFVLQSDDRDEIDFVRLSLRSDYSGDFFFPLTSSSTGVRRVA